MSHFNCSKWHLRHRELLLLLGALEIPKFIWETIKKNKNGQQFIGVFSVLNCKDLFFQINT
jgi:hypothetical protein